jgi:hypothetical protein
MNLIRLILIAMSFSAALSAQCKGNACGDIKTEYVGRSPTGCHTIKNVGKRLVHFIWGSARGDLTPDQTETMRNLDGSCLQYIIGEFAATYDSPPPKPEPTAHSAPTTPPGPDQTFKYIGDLYGEANQGRSAFNRVLTLCVCLDDDKKLDVSYQQQKLEGNGTGAFGDAKSPLKASQIPPGIFVKFRGGTGAVAMWEPKIETLSGGILGLDNGISVLNLLSGGPVQTFSMRVYCGPEPAPGEGCHVRIGVWAKQK